MVGEKVSIRTCSEIGGILERAEKGNSLEGFSG